MKLVTNLATAPSVLSTIRPSLLRTNDLVYIAGYASFDAAMELWAALKDARLRLLVGMATEDGLLRTQIVGLSRLNETLEARKGGVRITALPNHSKFAVGQSSEGAWTLFGSSNLSRAGLYERREANFFDADGDAAKVLLAEFESLWADALPVSLSPVRAPARPRSPIVAASAVLEVPPVDTDELSVRISLLSDSGEVHGGDGLNWWRDSASGLVRRNRPNEACIPIRASNRLAIAAVLGELNKGREFKVITHTGRILNLSLQGTGAGGKAKQIASAGDLQDFGRWALREVLKLPEGKMVTKKDLLERLNRTDITLTRISQAPSGNEPNYALDFAPELPGTE